MHASALERHAAFLNDGFPRELDELPERSAKRFSLPTGTKYTSDAGQVYIALEPMYRRHDGHFTCPARFCVDNQTTHASGLINQAVPAAWIDWSSVPAATP